MQIALAFAAMWLAYLGLNLVYVTTQAFVGRVCGATVKSLALGFGPVLVRATLASTPCELRTWPFGGHTQFFTSEHASEAAGPIEVPAGTNYLEAIPLHKQVLIFLGGPVSNLTLGLVLGGVALMLPGSQVVDSTSLGQVTPSAVPGLAIPGPTATVTDEIRLFDRAFVAFWRRFFTGESLGGWGRPLAWLITASMVLLRSPGAWVSCLSAHAIANGLLNLTPIPPLNGGRILGLCLSRIFRPKTPRQGNALAMLSMLCLFGVWLRLGYLDLIWVVRLIVPGSQG